MTRFSSVSRFDQILKDLRQRVQAGQFASEDRLPTERALADQYGCSQATMNKVIATLVAEGALERASSRGVSVASVPPIPARPKTALRFMGWIAAEALGREVWESMRKSFESSQPAVEVASLPVPFSSFQSRLTEMIGGGQAPDVAQIVNNWTSRFAEMGALLPLESRLSPKILQDHLTWKKRPNQFGGATYSIDWGLTPLLLFYNRTVMKSAGLDPDRPPRTVSELAAMAARIHQQKLSHDGEPVHGFGTPTVDPEQAANGFLPMLLAYGGRIVDAEGSVSLAASEPVAALDAYRNLVDTSGCPLGQSMWDLRKLFAQDRIGFLMDGSMGRGFYRKDSGLGAAFDSHFGVAPLPTAPVGRSVTFCPNHSLAILSQTSAPDEAVAFVEHLLSDRELAKRYYEEEGLIPARESLLALPEYREPYARIVLEQTQAGAPLPTQYPMFQMAMAFLGTTVERVLRKDENPREALRDAARNISLLFHGAPVTSHVVA